MFGDITAEQVKERRRVTGQGLQFCKAEIEREIVFNEIQRFRFNGDTETLGDILEYLLKALA